jgi:DNA (cytosine-5)-methyltransferase 1
MPGFKFIDLFCGIGGMRLAFEKADCECVFSSDWDKYSQQTYAANFGETPVGNIRDVGSEMIPDHGILVAGFPCQPFSISGVSKKNSFGRVHGFADKTQGTLFLKSQGCPIFREPRHFNDLHCAAIGVILRSAVSPAILQSA